MAAYLLACFSVVVGTVAASNPSLRGINSSHTLVANRPYWCQYVPAAYQQDACITCTCADSCYRDVQNVSSWKWMPECCACQKPDQHEQFAARQALVQTESTHIQTLTAPEWCKYVPVAFQQDACGTCACEHSCFNPDFDVTSWKWTPECCACQLQPEEGQSLVQTKQPAHLLQVPTWCQYVPAAYQRDACISCTCADSCHHDVQNASSWKWMPECCACQKPDQHEKHFANLAAMTTVQEVTKGVSSLAVPSWCKYVPSPYQGDACMSCACSSSCYSGDFDVASWKWNPDCCACQQ